MKVADEAFIEAMDRDTNPSLAKEAAMTRTETHTAADGTVYRIADLDAALRRAHDPDDWKAPIAVWCRGNRTRSGAPSPGSSRKSSASR